MMTKQMISRVALALALLVATVGAATLQADTLDRVAPQVAASGAEGGPTVRVMNNHVRRVKVFAIDSNNRRRLLGRVSPSRVKDLQIPEGLVRDTGTVQLKVYPILPSGRIGASAFEPAGIKTRELSVQSDQVIHLYLKRDLTTSVVGIV